MAAGLAMGLASARATEGGDSSGGPEAPIGRKIEDFRLKDAQGGEHSLGDFAKSRLVVVAFLGTECPLAKLYGTRLGEMARQRAVRDVAFVGIDSNRQDSNTELLHYGRLHGIEFPLLKDVGNEIADRFGAVRTPEVFVLDEQRTIRYWGRVDDQYGVGFGRPEATRQDLSQALDELLAGGDVTQRVTPAPGCYIGRVREPEANAQVTWSREIAPIFQKHCQDCHRPGQIGPFPLLEYADVVGWSETIGEVVREGRMPPWHAESEYGHFANDARMTPEELARVEAWVKSGAPEGDPADLPPPRKFSEGWQLRHPDQVVYMSETPFTVPAEGIVPYQWFEADPGFTEDKWVKAVECRPGNPAVVHHVTVYFHPPGTDWNLQLRERINMVGGFAPGKRPIDVEGVWDGTARFIPAGSKFKFEMHYTPNGTEQTDRSSIALVFAEPEEVKRQMSLVLVANNEFEIPPHADNHRVESWYTLDEETLLYSLSPHMHLRGKSFACEAIYPDGEVEQLLNVPRFDFNWQNDYMYPVPKRVPKGTKVHCVAHFDNSAENLSNPDPARAVRWGDQIWEEMMIGAIAIAPAEQDLQAGVGKPAMVHGTRRWRIGGLTLVGLSLALAVGGVAWNMRHRPRA